MPTIDKQSRKKALKAYNANITERFERLDKLEKYCYGNQYDHMPDFFDQRENVPLIERAPKIVYPIVANAIRSNVDLCLGEGRFPSITSFVSQDNLLRSEVDIDRADGDKVDAFIKAIIEQARIKSVARESLFQAQMSGSCCAVFSIRRARLRADTVLTKWCDPEFSSNDMEVVTKLTISYPYIVEEWDQKSKTVKSKCMMYKRVIDEMADITFKPVECSESGEPIAKSSWVPDPKMTYNHKLGFCPAIWYRHMPEHSTVYCLDGKPIHEHVLDEIDCLNYSLSQRHRAALYSGEPQMWETGVDKDENPSALGRVAAPIIHNDDTGESYYDSSSAGGGGSQSARRKGPGVVWRYSNQEARVGMMTLPGDALKPAEENARDLRNKIAESMSVVFLDPDILHVGTEVSGRTLGWLHHKQTARCDQIRSDFGDNWLVPAVNMLLRLAREGEARGDINLPGASQVMPLIDKFAQIVDDSWFGPRLTLDWGPYFEPTELDQKHIVQGTLALQRGGVITRRTAVERVADFYDIGNIDEYMSELEKDAGESQRIMQATPSQNAQPGQVPKQNKVPPKGSTLSGIIEPVSREVGEL